MYGLGGGNHTGSKCRELLETFWKGDCSCSFPASFKNEHKDSLHNSQLYDTRVLRWLKAEIWADLGCPNRCPCFCSATRRHHCSVWCMGRGIWVLLCETGSGLTNAELAVVESHSLWTSAVLDSLIKWFIWLWEPKMDVFEGIGYSSVGKQYSPVETDFDLQHSNLECWGPKDFTACVWRQEELLWISRGLDCLPACGWSASAFLISSKRSGWHYETSLKYETKPGKRRWLDDSLQTSIPDLNWDGNVRVPAGDFCRGLFLFQKGRLFISTSFK